MHVPVLCLLLEPEKVVTLDGSARQVVPPAAVLGLVFYFHCAIERRAQDPGCITLSAKTPRAVELRYPLF